MSRHKMAGTCLGQLNEPLAGICRHHVDGIKSGHMLCFVEESDYELEMCRVRQMPNEGSFSERIFTVDRLIQPSSSESQR